MWEVGNYLLPQFLYKEQGKIFPHPVRAGTSHQELLAISLNTSMELLFEITLFCTEGEFPSMERGQASLERDEFKGQGYGLDPDQNPFLSTTCSC